MAKPAGSKLFKGRGIVVITGLAFLALGLVASVPIGWAGSAGLYSDERHPQSSDRAVSRAAPQKACDEIEPERVALVARLGPGTTIDELRSSEYKVTRAVDGGENEVVVLRPTVNPFPLKDIPAYLQADAALESIGWLHHMTMDLSLRSCDYRLSDNPAALKIATQATAWMVANGVLTQEQIDAGGTTFQLAEDPTNATHLFFTVVLAKSTGGGPGSPRLSELLIPFTATIEKATGEILSAGRAHWYDFQ